VLGDTNILEDEIVMEEIPVLKGATTFVDVDSVEHEMTTVLRSGIVFVIVDILNVITLGSTVLVDDNMLDNGITVLVVNVAWKFVIILVVELIVVNDAAVEYTSLLGTHVYVESIHFPLARLKVHSMTSLLACPPKIKPSLLASVSELHSTKLNLKNRIMQ